VVSTVVVAAGNVPGPVAAKVRLVKGQAKGTSEFVVSEGAIAMVVSACIEPSTVFRINEESFTRTHVFIAWYRKYFG